MSDLQDQSTDTNATNTAIAQHGAAPTTISKAMPWAVESAAIAQQGADSTTTTTAIPPVSFANASGSTNPYLVYLSQLGVGSRRTMRESLDSIARMVSEGSLNALNFPWSELRYQHTQAIYTHLLENHAPATANKMIAAVGRVLKEAWKLGQMSAEDYHRAVAIERRTGQRLLKAGR